MNTTETQSAVSSMPWFGDGICRYCSKPVAPADAVVTHSYWQGMKFVSHKACKVAGEKAEALECQTIDADCNDCRHFRRGQLVGKEVWSGHCQKYDRETRAYPKKWTGRECFEHRRAESPNAELSESARSNHKP